MEFTIKLKAPIVYTSVCVTWEFHSLFQSLQLLLGRKKHSMGLLGSSRCCSCFPVWRWETCLDRKTFATTSLQPPAPFSIYNERPLLAKRDTGICKELLQNFNGLNGNNYILYSKFLIWCCIRRFGIMFCFLTSFGSGSPLFCSTKMKKAKRRLTVDPIDFERECDYKESGQRSNQVKSAPLAVMI